MKEYYVSVRRADESSGFARVTYSGYPTVTIEITGINSADSKWRISGRKSLGDTNIYLNGKGLGTFTFDSEDNKSYIFQIQNWNGDWVNTSNVEEAQELSIFNVNFEYGGSGDSGDSGDDDDYDEDCCFYFTAGEGTELYVEDEDDYGRNMTSGEVINVHHVFSVYVIPTTGYQNAKVTFTNFNVTRQWKWTDPDNTSRVFDAYTGHMDELGDIEATSSASLKSYKLSATAGIGSYITVNRISSKKSGATLGVLKNGATIYHFDTLQITVGVDDGYDIVDTVVSGCTENSNGTFTVTGNTKVTVTTELLGLVYIDDGTTFLPCFIFIDNGTNWEQCMPYVDDGTSWHLCS